MTDKLKTAIEHANAEATRLMKLALTNLLTAKELETGRGEPVSVAQTQRNGRTLNAYAVWCPHRVTVETYWLLQDTDGVHKRATIEAVRLFLMPERPPFIPSEAGKRGV